MKRANTGIGLLFALGLSVAPVVVALSYTAAYSTGLTGVLSTGFTMQHWQAVLGDSSFWYSLLYSLYIAVASIVISATLAFFIMLHYKSDWLKGRLRFLISLPLVFPALLVAFLILQWCSKAGLLSRIAYNAGAVKDLGHFPDFVNDLFGIGIILGHVLMVMPFFVLLFSNIYNDSRMDDYAALSASLGAGKRQFQRHVLMPILLRRAFPALMLYGIFVMGAYEVPLLLGRSYPQMLSMLTVQKLMRFNLEDKPQAYVIALLIFCITMLLLQVMFHFKKQSDAAEAQ